MRITILGSGSRGNAALIEAGGTRILVDAGITPRDIRERAAAAGSDVPEKLDAIVITHAHADHVGHARTCAEAFDAPLYATQATHRSVAYGGAARTRVFDARVPFRIGAIELRPLPVPHDAPQVALVFTHGEASAALVTDLGTVRRDLLEHLRGCSTLLFESNHDPSLLAIGPYPPEIQRRVSSGAGHLSNAQCAAALEALAPGLDEVVLVHLSAANNEPHLALTAAERALATARRKIRLRAAAPDTPLVVDAGPRKGQLPLFR